MLRSLVPADRASPSPASPRAALDPDRNDVRAERRDEAGPLVIGAITQLWGVRIGFLACGGIALILVVVLALQRPQKDSSQ